MRKSFFVSSLMALLAIMLAACQGGQPQAADLLQDIKNRGYILISTDPNYEPQSFLNANEQRLAQTKCPADALTANQMQGFDVDVAIEIGNALGVETCFATPDWDMITAGNWANKWDMSVGSMTITVERQKILDFSVPYYYTPAVVAVRSDANFTSLDDLAGQTLCAGAATTYEAWLNGDKTALGLPESSIYAAPPAGVKVVTLTTDQECAQAIAAGRTDFIGYVASSTVVDANIAAGMPVKKLGTPIFSEELAAAFDKASRLSNDTLRAEVDKLFQAMHANGRLAALSVKWFGQDLTQSPK